MRLESVHVSNFRSLRDVTVTFGGLTILIGANSSGKTSVLEALRFFGRDHIDISEHDFFPGTTTMEIEVTIVPEKHDSIPQEYLIDGKIMLQKAADLDKGGEVTELLRIKKMCIGDLVDVRNLRTAKERQARMKSLSEKHPGLQHRGAWPGSLNSYEHDHLDDPAHRGKYAPHFIDLGQSEFGEGSILDMMYVPAVSDMEADAADDGASPLSGLVDAAIRRPGKHDARLEKIIGAANKKIGRLMHRVDREGDRLAKKMRKRALPYVDDTEFELGFKIPGLKNARPRATLTLREESLPIPVDRAGSGLQRIALIALLETIYSMGGQAAGAGEGAQGSC